VRLTLESSDYCLPFFADAIAMRPESPNYFVYVSNERSGDVTVIDGPRDMVMATLRKAEEMRFVL
jgi:hypothetical protein